MTDPVYLYGFIATDAGASPDLEGVGQRPVEVLERDGLAAVVSRVPADEFSADTVEERMHDPAWLSEQGARHERVVTWFVDHAEIVPVRLLSLYSSEDALDAAIAERRDEVLETMERLRGRREWDLKVSRRPDELEAALGEVSEEIAEIDREIEEAAPGRRFLLERKRAQLARKEGARAATSLGEELLERLEPLAEAVRRPPLPREVRDEPPVLNAALLVCREREAELQEAVEAETRELDARGITVELTGPWAPYRFVGTPDGDGDDDDEGDGDGEAS